MSYSPTEFLKIAHQTAEHFGFQTIDQLKKHPVCKDCVVSLPHTITATNKRTDSHGGLLSNGAISYCEDKLHALNEPILLYAIEQMPRTGEPAVTFHIFNVERSIAEAILIQVTRALANELGHTEHTVRINSLGDRESVSRYTREITNYLKKRLDHMPPQARELMKEHPLTALSSLVDVDHELAHRSPSPLEFLSDGSRKHFREIIEYLDMSETPYEIDPKMLGHHEYYSDAIFSLDIKDEEGNPSSLSIKGGRFNEFMQRNTKSKTPAAGAVAILKNSKTPARIPRPKAAIPSVYVIHLGFGPKIRSLMLIDELRQAGISVIHNLASDSLSAQLRDAESRGVRYALIMGQKEFVENTVILRDLKQSNQEFVEQSVLVKKLKKNTPATVS
jgi:histidyl-tRNA synthetase